MTSNQACAIVSTLIANANWDSVDFTVLAKRIKEDPIGVGREFTRFLKAGACMPLGDMKIATAPFNVEEFIGKKWKILPEEQDKRSAELTEVDLSGANFFTCLTATETLITGEEKLFRLKMEKSWIRYGASVFMGLWKDYQANKEKSVLEQLYQRKGITYPDFFGDVLERPNGDRHVLGLYRDVVGTWRWHYYWLGDVWNTHFLSVVSSQMS